MIIVLNTNNINRTRRFWKSKLESFIENGKISRRDFLKLICAGGIAIALTPLIPFGKVLELM